MSSSSLFSKRYAPTPTGIPVALVEWHKANSDAPQGHLTASLAYELPGRTVLSAPVYRSEWGPQDKAKAIRAVRAAARRNGFMPI